MTTRYRPQAPFGIGAEQFLGVSELGPSPPTEQAVDRETSLDVVDEEQMGVLARKPSLLHNRGNHLLSAALDDALRHPGVRVVIQVKQIIVIVCRRALAEGARLRSLERRRRRQGLVDKRVEQRELVLIVQIKRAAVDIGAAADIVGCITSAFIQEPFWALTAQLPQAGYIAVNNKTQFLPCAIEDWGLAVRADIADVLADVRKTLGR
ncbi:hypothetical protein [Ellagibacter isourolithinifaciens]|uniref:hypothetical protein n=1 Tax=Ellagibacter isourolithinifaciens TaxID=2137581 RepID=UPI003A94A85B